MDRTVWISGLIVVLMVVSGCTPVQKSSVAGGAIGSAAGAGIGHTISALGSGPGALIGLGLGAAGGAIAAESYYGSDDSESLAAAQTALERLSNEVKAKDAKIQEMTAALEKEKAQQKALLEAYDKARTQSPQLAAQTVSRGRPGATDSAVTFTILSEVLFKSGAADVTAEGKAALHKAALTIRKDYPNARIEVRGHTDNVPIRYSPYKSNWELSMARALAVVHYLIESEGFRADQLTAVGCGETRPVASNSTAAGRRRNRRAEIVVYPQPVQIAEANSYR